MRRRPGSCEAGKAKMILLSVVAVVTLLVLAGTVLLDFSSPLPTSQPTGEPLPRIETPQTKGGKQRREPEPLPLDVLSG